MNPNIATARQRGQLSRLDYFADYALRHGCSEAVAWQFATYCERLVAAGSPLSNPRHLRVILAAYSMEAA